ncbi:MAG: acyl carrier protein [Erysipelotrichaceae bacterium]|nr:acyl carrier protein [Erysipelotrichaceae bacterium]
MSVFDKVKEIIIDELNVDADKVTLDASLKDDLGADSIDAVQIIMDLEDAFNIEIDTDNAEAISTVKNIVDYIESLVK